MKDSCVPTILCPFWEGFICSVNGRRAGQLLTTPPRLLAL